MLSQGRATKVSRASRRCPGRTARPGQVVLGQRRQVAGDEVPLLDLPEIAPLPDHGRDHLERVERSRRRRGTPADLLPGAGHEAGLGLQSVSDLEDVLEVGYGLQT